MSKHGSPWADRGEVPLGHHQGARIESVQPDRILIRRQRGPPQTVGAKPTTDFWKDAETSPHLNKELSERGRIPAAIVEEYRAASK
jgi:hypothetical protein